MSSIEDGYCWPLRPSERTDMNTPSLPTLKANAEKAILQIESGKTLALMACDPIAIIRAYLDALERENKELHASNDQLAEQWKSASDKLLKAARIAELERGCQEPTSNQDIKVGGAKPCGCEYNEFCYECNPPKPTLTFSDALRIARGCLDDYEVMDEIGLVHVGGIQTVINALEAAERENNL